MADWGLPRPDETIKVWTGYVRRSQLGPRGLCADRTEHPGHLHESPSLGRFWCTGDPADREPGRSERRARADGAVYGIRPHLPMTADELAERERAMRATPLGLPDHTLGDPSSSTPSPPRSSGSA